ncbi:MAG: amidohydrolase family protein [Candidatus Aegiribacteria sp.]|nr:amidohydrolase family protein [Candidatus Aegiribacteria sp.]
MHMKQKYNVAGIMDDGFLRLEAFSIEMDKGSITSVTRESCDGKWNNCIAVPGLIQSHIHLGQTLFRGMAERRSLLPWLSERILPLEAAHSRNTLAVSVIQSLGELLASGCTGLLDMGVLKYSEIAVDILRSSGVRALAGNALMDIGPEYTTENLSWLKEETTRVKKACGDLVSYIYAPRFALSCSDDIWGWLSDLPAGIKRTTHAAETSDEMNHPSIMEAGGNIHYLKNRGFIGPDTLLAHCVHLLEGEQEILRQSNTTVVHCPWANLKLGSGIADIPALTQSHIRVILGSDGAACNNRLDVAGDARLAMGLASVTGSPSSLPSDFWFRSITSSAANALGWENTGKIAPGYAADLVLIEPSAEEWEELILTEDPVRYLLELDWPSRVRLTIVDGRIVYQDGFFPTLPKLPMEIGRARQEIYQKAFQISGKSVLQ